MSRFWEKLRWNEWSQPEPGALCARAGARVPRTPYTASYVPADTGEAFLSQLRKEFEGSGDRDRRVLASGPGDKCQRVSRSGLDQSDLDCRRPAQKDAPGRPATASVPSRDGPLSQGRTPKARPSPSDLDPLAVPHDTPARPPTTPQATTPHDLSHRRLPMNERPFSILAIESLFLKSKTHNTIRFSEKCTSKNPEIRHNNQ
jgi:hypothetical protein